MPVSGSVEKRRDSLRIYPEIFELAKKREVEVEIEVDDKVLNPFSTLRLRFKKGNKILLEKETILKCDNLEECFFCFNQTYTYIILEKTVKVEGKERKEKVSIPVKWLCLNWDGIPIFESDFFDEAYIKDNRVLLFKKNQMNIIIFKELRVEGKGNLFRVIHENKVYYFGNLIAGEEYDLVCKYFDGSFVVHNND